MKTTSRILCALLVLAMALAIVPAGVFAAKVEEAFNATITDTASNELPANATNVTYLTGSDTSVANEWKGTAWDGTNVKAIAWGTGGCPENVVFWDVTKAQTTTLNYVFNGSEEPTMLTSTDAGYTTIMLGKNSAVFEHGISPNAGKSTEQVTVFTNNGSTRFYAVYGANGSNSTLTTVTTSVRVYGSTDESNTGATWTLLAACPISGYQVANFDVDISGYKLIKLTQESTASGGGRYGSWGNACVYTPAAAEPDVKNNVRFGNSLSLLTSWSQAAYADADCVEVTYKGNTAGFDLSTTTISGNPYWAVEFPGLPAKEMTEEMSVSLLDANKKTLNTVTASVRDYALEYLANGDNDTYKTALYHMLQYGAAAQEYFPNNSTLANAGLEEFEGKVQTINVPTVTNVRGATKGAEYFYATNLRLENQIGLIFYFKNLPAYTNIKFTWDGGEATGTPVTNGDVTMVVLDQLPVKDFMETVTCTVYNGETEVVVATDSVAGYALRAQSKGNEQLANVCTELLKYAEAVRVALG